MNDVTVIDRFLDTFSRYIDSGFGLLQGEVAFLTATLIVIDMTIAGLYWAMSHATGQGDDVIAKLLRKVLYVGALQATQATNQLLALQARQAIQAQQLQITQGRAASLELARHAAATERAREVRRRFLGDGTPYTPYPVNFYGN